MYLNGRKIISVNNGNNLPPVETKIDSISIAGVEQQPDANKNVNLPAYPTRASLLINNVDNTSDEDKPLSAIQRQALENKQDKIDSTHKLNADYVDDTNSANKFVTAGEKGQITTNEQAIADIKNGTSIDSFGDVETELASKVNSNEFNIINLSGEEGTLTQAEYDSITMKTIINYTTDGTILTLKNCGRLIGDNGGWVFQLYYGDITRDGQIYAGIGINSDRTWTATTSSNRAAWLNDFGYVELNLANFDETTHKASITQSQADEMAKKFCTMVLTQTVVESGQTISYSVVLYKDDGWKTDGSSSLATFRRPIEIDEDSMFNTYTISGGTAYAYLANLEVLFKDVTADSLVPSTKLYEVANRKQDTLTAGTGINITNNTIKVTGTEYSNASGQAAGELKFVSLSQAEYDALATKDSNTLYIIV